jgi:uncharacterized glyoxalase superfamily protein PhnB
MNVTGILFWVQENKISEKFYKKLGFDIQRSDDEASVVELNGFTITLVAMRDEDEFSKDSMATEKGRGVYTYIKVNNVDEWYQKLLELGIKPATEPRDWQWGNREFIVKDPDGYKLCFWQLS